MSRRWVRSDHLTTECPCRIRGARSSREKECGMGVYDVTARRAAKREPVGFFRWVLPHLDSALTFAGWLDARTAPAAPETELTCDALAEFVAAARPEEPWMLVAEFQTEPRSDDLERVF